jgi:hypothetical protein
MRFFKPIYRQETSPVKAKIAQRKRERSHQYTLTETKENIDFGLLYQNENKEWRIATKHNREEVPVGSYVFVRTTTGFTRVVPSFHGAHSVLAEYRNELRYAGEVIFDQNGQLIEWNNGSGAYHPPTRLRVQANLPLEKFVAAPGSESPIFLKRTIKKIPEKTGVRHHLNGKYQSLHIAVPKNNDEPVNSSSSYSEPTTSPPRLSLGR